MRKFRAMAASLLLILALSACTPDPVPTEPTATTAPVETTAATAVPTEPTVPTEPEIVCTATEFFAGYGMDAQGNVVFAPRPGVDFQYNLRAGEDKPFFTLDVNGQNVRVFFTVTAEGEFTYDRCQPETEAMPGGDAAAFLEHFQAAFGVETADYVTHLEENVVSREDLLALYHRVKLTKDNAEMFLQWQDDEEEREITHSRNEEEYAYKTFVTRRLYLVRAVPTAVPSNFTVEYTYTSAASSEKYVEDQRVEYTPHKADTYTEEFSYTGENGTYAPRVRLDAELTMESYAGAMLNGELTYFRFFKEVSKMRFSKVSGYVITCDGAPEQWLNEGRDGLHYYAYYDAQGNIRRVAETAPDDDTLWQRFEQDFLLSSGLTAESIPELVK